GYRRELRPSVHFRPFEENVGTPHRGDYEVRSRGNWFEIDSRSGYPPLRLYIAGRESHCIYDGGSMREIIYARDAERGYESRGSLWSPGYFSARLGEGEVSLIASTEDWHVISALEPEAAFA